MSAAVEEFRAAYGVGLRSYVADGSETHLRTAYELGRENIIVNAISPGPIATMPTLSRPPEVTKKRVEQYVPFGRLGEPEEIAELALYLATASPAFLQGQDIVIDGGYIIH